MTKTFHIPVPENCKAILRNFSASGYTALIVGGFVRDAVLGKTSKDIDIEVYGIEYHELCDILSRFGTTNTVGKSFGIVKLTDKFGDKYDFSIPRLDSKVEETTVGKNGGNRGRGIQVKFDANITPKEAARRRDFTFNALAYDPLEEVIHDYYGGLEDIENKVIRATSDQFAEDPLRVLRGFQFAARFGFDVDAKTAELAKRLKKDRLVIERESEEWKKFLTLGIFPKKGLEYLVKTEWIERYPELCLIQDVPQEPEWHPEGNVFEHTGYVVNAAANIVRREEVEGDDRIVIIAAALCHDFGKALTTKKEEKDGVERLTTKGHDVFSEQLTYSFLKRIGIKKTLIARAAKLVRWHMLRTMYCRNSSKGNILRVAENLWPATVQELIHLIEADCSGRPPEPANLPSDAKEIESDARFNGVLNGKATSLITGDDILPMVGASSPLIGELLNKIREQQISGNISSQREALNLIRHNLLPINGNDVMEVIGFGPGPEVGRILDKAWNDFILGKKIDIEWLESNS